MLYSGIHYRRLCNSFARIRRKICVIPTLHAFFFGSDCNADSINSQRRCEACAAHAGRMHAFFCARDVPDFRKFGNLSREFCAKFASSRRWTRALSCIRTHADSAKSCNEVLQFAQSRWSSLRNFCARGAPKCFGDFAILSRELGAKFA